MTGLQNDAVGDRLVGRFDRLCGVAGIIVNDQLYFLTQYAAGGVGRANAPAYRRLPNVLCVGGSWPVPGGAVAAGDWSRIEALAREAAGF